MTLFKISALVMITSVLAACSQEKVEKKEKIIVGFGPSTYITQFEKGVQPYLENMGYEVEAKTFSQNRMVPQALKEGEIQASVHISEAHMIPMNKHLNMNMILWADTPSAPQSLRSVKHTSLSEIKDGMSIGLPLDAINLERAARVLEELGWVTVEENVDPATFKVESILPGQYQLKLITMEAAQLPRAMEDLDFAIINGNYVASQGQRISDGLVVEKSPPEHLIKVAILEKNQNEQWAKDLKAAYESKDFETYIKSERLYDGFIYPAHWAQ